MANREEKLDRTGKDSFPASDPPASTGIIGPRVEGAEKAAESESAPKDAEKPKGGPTDGRGTTPC